MKSVLPFACSIALYAMSSATGVAATVDFEDQTLGETAPVSEGFVFSGGAFNSSGSDEAIAAIAIGANGTQVFQVDYLVPCDSGGCGGVSILMESVGGDPFSFFGADVFIDDLDGSGVDIVGFKVGGGLATGTIGTGDWLNLESVGFNVNVPFKPGFVEGVLEIDNVQATVVPIPAAFWLLGSALTGLGMLRRSRSV